MPRINRAKIAMFVAAAVFVSTSTIGRADLSMNSEKLNYGALRPGDSRTQEIVLKNNGDASVTLSSFEAECTTCTKVPKDPIVVAPGAVAKIPVTFTAQPADSGAITRHVSFATTEPKQKRITVAFDVVVGTSAAIVPSILNLSRREPGADVTAEFELVNLSDTSLKAMYTTGPVEGPKLTLPQGEIKAGTSAKLKATWHLPAKPGDISGQLTVFVDHPKITRLTLPYRVTIAAAATTQATTTPANGASTTSPATTKAADSTGSTTTVAATATAPVPMVNLNLKENLPLKDFVDIVATQLKLNFIFDDAQLSSAVSIRLNAPIPADALLPLLKTILQSKGLAIVGTERPEIWRIVTSREALALAEPGKAIKADGPEQIVTELVRPTSLDLEVAAGILRGFQTANLGQITTLPTARALVVTDYAPQVARLKRLLELVDKPQAAAAVEVISLKQAEPTPLADRITKLLSQVARAENRAESDKVFITPDEIGRSLTIIAPSSQLPRITELIQRFDTAPGLTRVDYPVSDQIRITALDTIRQVLGAGSGAAGSDGMPRIISTAQRVSVLATEGQHKRIKDLLGQQDPGTEGGGILIRAYTIQNRDAAEIQATLSHVLGDVTGANVSIELSPPRLRGSGIISTEGITKVGEPIPPAANEKPSPGAPSPAPVTPRGSTSGAINVTVDAGTNTLLVSATADMHKKLSSLIEQLDKKQAQVLLDVMLVTVADSDTLAYAVDAAIKAHFAGATIGIGTDAGISKGDFINGRTSTIGPGINAAIFNPASFSLFMRALATTNKARIVSMPQILALDNKAAILRSLQQQPFTSVNASSTVATTSFGGFAEAGTTLELTPHIAPADYLNLEYRLELSSFTGDSSSSGGATVPPPRRSDTISSYISVPDGSTVVVGGLSLSSDSKSVSKVPGLGEIPILGLLGRNESNSHNKAMFYVFVRPMILRSRGFEDLKFVSQDIKAAMGVASEFPESKLHYLP